MDGEMSPSEAALFERQLASSPEDQDRVARLKAVKAVLTPANVEAKVPHSREFYWSRIQRQIEHETQTPRRVRESFLARWRRFLVPFAGVVGMAALLLFSIKEPAPAFEDYTVTSDDMDSLTFHDNTAGMTVVWLQEKNPQDPQNENAYD